MLLNLEDLINKYDCKIEGVLHIGANDGGEYQTYNRLLIYPIIFVEPLPNVFEQLVKNVGSNCICLNTALGNMESEVEMYVDTANNGGSSSILTPKLHLTQYPHIAFTHKLKVPITTVDKLDIPKCNFINMDVQGYELQVLYGAVNYLQSVKYVMLEVNRDELYENCARVEQIDEFLGNYEFTRVETAWDGVTWGDAFYIKNTL